MKYIILCLCLFCLNATARESSICEAVRAAFPTQESWDVALNSASTRLTLFNSSPDSSGWVQSFVEKYRDGFALSFLEPGPLSNLDRTLMVRLMGLYQTSDRSRNLVAELSSTEWRERLQASTPHGGAFYEKSYHGINYAHLRHERERASQMAEPLLEFLLDQQPRSLKPTDLLLHAISLYRQPLVAYALIAFVFFEEAKGSKSRPYHQVLASKMVSMDVTGDHVGMNYHYWVYFSLGLHGKTRLGNLSSFFLERLRQNDPQERSADLEGLRAGDQMRKCWRKLEM